MVEDCHSTGNYYALPMQQWRSGSFLCLSVTLIRRYIVFISFVFISFRFHRC